MKITQDVRDYAKKHGLNDQEALEEGMKDKMDEFKEKGNDLYLEPEKLVK